MDTPSPYLVDLTLRLGAGIGQLPAEQRERHAQFFLSAQQADGGFAGRDAPADKSGPSDLYYTAFAVRSLALLDRLDKPTAERVAQFLASQVGGNAHVVDLFSLVFSAQLLDMAAGVDAMAGQPAGWQERVAAGIETLRRTDGGYAKGPEGSASSTYYSFLATLTRELLEQPTAEADKLVSFIETQQREDGGYVEIRPMRRSGVNPTAAAVGTLKTLGQQPSDTDGVIDFLADQQTDEGGLRANTRIPIADLLSTFTGLLTLADLDAGNEVDLAEVRRFADSLEQPKGGFLAAAWDEAVDVEYSFYGLALLGLLESLKH